MTVWCIFFGVSGVAYNIIGMIENGKYTTKLVKQVSSNEVFGVDLSIL